jgi:secreted trypsin-like serine protease
MRSNFFLSTLFASALLWNSSQAIVSGEAQDAATPYIVSLVSSGWFGDTHICGGVIIGSKTVLTAAHCVDGSSASSLKVKYGGTDRTNLKVTIQVTQVTMHPNWNTNTIDNDYAILRLQTTVTETDGNPMTTYGTLATLRPKTGSEVSISGWGLTNGSDTQLPEQLQRATLKALEAGACNTKWQDVNRITKNMACAESKSGSFCKSDDGGPVTDTAGSTIYGILSWQSDGCPADSTVRPNVYADVAESSVASWIGSNTE